MTATEWPPADLVEQAAIALHARVFAEAEARPVAWSDEDGSIRELYRRDATAALRATFSADPRLIDPMRIEGTWLVVESGKHNCAGGTVEAGYAHERGCGLEPVVNLAELPGWPGSGIIEEYREAYESWRKSGQGMHRALLDIWRMVEPCDTTHATFGDDPSVVFDAVRAAMVTDQQAERRGAVRALRELAHSFDLGQTKPHTREDVIGAAGAPDIIRERADAIERGQS